MANCELNDQSLPDIDNLYVDLIELVHKNTPSDTLSGLIPHLAPACPLEEIWASIFTAIELLLQMTKPRRLVYIAINGVLPVAKAVQERNRLYKYIHEVEAFLKNERDSGRTVAENWFDASGMTPGTDFMAALAQQIEFFIKWKFASDPNWKDLDVIVSGADVPGEGKHKILNYLRLSDNEPSLRHCIYGCDSDLALLGLTTHQPYVMILSDYRSTSSHSAPDRAVQAKPPIKVLFLNLVREYMQAEIVPESGLDLEQFIDDFVLLALFFVNEAMPKNPTFDLAEGSLDFFIERYRQTWPSIGYLTSSGVINWGSLKEFIRGIVALEDSVIAERIQAKAAIRRPYALLKPVRKPCSLQSLFTKESSRPAHEDRREPELDDADRDSRENIATKDLKARLKTALSQGVDRVKALYYLECLRVDVDSFEGAAVVSELAAEFLRGLQWTLCGYYRGCPDWEWSYPSHYCPTASDLFLAIDTIEVEANGGMLPFKGRGPILTLEHMLMVLPLAAKRHLPREVAELYSDPELTGSFPEAIQVEYDIMSAAVNWHSCRHVLPFCNLEKIRARLRTVSLSQTSLLKNEQGQEQIWRRDFEAPTVRVRSLNMKCNI